MQTLRACWGFGLACLLIVIAHVARADSGRLARARSEVESGSSRGRAHHSHHGRRHDDQPGWFAALLCVFLPCGEPGAIPDISVDPASDDSEEQEPDEALPVYAAYPYASQLTPYLLAGGPQLASADDGGDLALHVASERAAMRGVAGQVMLDGGYFEGVAHGGVDARLLTPSRLEFALRDAFLYEPHARDSALLGSIEGGLRIVQSPALLLRLTGGLFYFGLPQHLDLGGQVALAMDLFLGRPWVLSARAGAGVIGNALIPEVRAQLGYLFARTELFAAFDYMRVGDVDLRTPLIGVRVWL